MESNLKIKSNVYLMPENFSVCHLFKISSDSKKFIQAITDRKTFEKLPENLKGYGSDFQIKEYFGVCSAHPIQEKTYGKINKEGVYGCRCNIKDTCHNRKIVIKELMRAGKKIGCESCPRYKD